MRRLLAALAGDSEIEALLSDAAQVAAIVRFEVALAQAEADAGVIGPAAAVAITEAGASFVPDWDGLVAGMARDGVVAPAFVEQLRAVIGEPYAADLHRGATSQDAVDTALILQLAKIIPCVVDRLAQLEAALTILDHRFGASRLMAHTRGQAALPFTVTDKIRTWSAPLARHREALIAMQPDLLVIQLGGPIGDRSGFDGKADTVATALAARLGLGVAPAWHSARDRIITLGARLAALSGSLGKFGADIALMAQSEVGSVALAGSGRSSAMPHKANPVAAETLVALAQQAAGLAGTLNLTMIHENERSGSAWTLEWLTLPRLIVSTGASLKTALALAGQITAIGDTSGHL